MRPPIATMIQPIECVDCECKSEAPIATKAKTAIGCTNRCERWILVSRIVVSCGWDSDSATGAQLAEQASLFVTEIAQAAQTPLAQHLRTPTAPCS